MKKYIYLLVVLVLNVACEDVIDVEVPNEEPRLVVDALIRVDIDELFIPVEVKLSLSSDFFNDNTPTSAETVVIQYEEYEGDRVIDTRFSNLAELEPGSGIYTPDPNFDSDQRIPTNILDRNWVFNLLINHQGRRYLATTKYVPAVPIDSLVQGDGTLFNDDETEIIVTFTDDPERDSFYLFDFSFSEFLVTEDKFYKGQQFSFSYFYDKIFEPNTEIEIGLMGADQTFFNYMDLLIEQTTNDAGIFSTPVATVRGNVFDITDIDNIDVSDSVGQPNIFPLGYFAIVQEYKDTLVIQ
ncbi:DUF4249 family protein [uncultured Eudoraea sp.]|jgi:hypothetical protein|uniref:DUF4249 family protein n=1 Tax=uncultured Eudoraea sp. TaxID=1035614 RepID=UPI0026019D22|nr:DUF4249 family protein [uncultured Eudoraea sp.]